ncbi:hypothetical protein TrVE_jg14168 [Triparma verrucosa]|uniref:Uncharacterized protein n=1 Tax=Triparma verrucosa TaxID=1606542 RepID=A0A9W7BZA5_9STRA|nr:hypothetical protein TrVE_jg14168 [Triparma verrucosa]
MHTMQHLIPIPSSSSSSSATEDSAPPILGVDFGTSSTTVTLFTPPSSYTPLKLNHAVNGCRNPCRNPSSKNSTRNPFSLPSTITFLDSPAEASENGYLGPWTFRYTLLSTPSGPQKLLDPNGPNLQHYTIGLPPPLSTLSNLKNTLTHSSTSPHLLESSKGQIIKLYLTSLLSSLTSTPPLLLLTRPSHWNLKTSYIFSSIFPKNFGVLTEPLASSIAYNCVRSTLIVDVGAGTSDVCLVVFREGEGKVVVSEGMGWGGNDVDGVLGEVFGGGGWKSFKEELCGGNGWNDGTGEEKIEPVERVDVGGRIVELEEFREVVRDKILPRITEFVDEASRGYDFEDVILVGGSCHLPGLKEWFKGKRVHDDINPFTSCSIGACIKGSVVFGGREGESVRREWGDVVGCDVGIGEGDDWVKIIERDSICPTRGSLWFTVPPRQNGVTIILSEKVNNKLERLGEFNFLLAKVEDDGERRVEVFVDCKEGGVFVEIFDEWDWEHRVKFGRTNPGDEEGAKKSGREMVLMVLVIFLAAAWLAARIAFNVVIVQDTTSESDSEQQPVEEVAIEHEHEEF